MSTEEETWLEDYAGSTHDDVVYLKTCKENGCLRTKLLATNARRRPPCLLLCVEIPGVKRGEHFRAVNINLAVRSPRPPDF
jgi:hypothetical protein